MKRILIDARMVGPRLHGIARYVSLLARGLRELEGKSSGLGYEPVFLVDPRLWEPGSDLLGGFETIECAARFLSPAEWIAIPRALSGTGASAYHSPSFASLPRCPVPWIQTLHDLNHLTYGDRAKKLYYRTLLRRFARGAKALVAASEFARREMESWLECPPGRVLLARNVLDPSFAEPAPVATRERVLAARGLENGKFFLCLSPNKPHKNLVTLLSAYAMARAEVTASGGALWPLVVTAQDLPGGSAEGVIATGSLRDEEARALLESAGALAFPSLYEGFGLPPLEAASIGVTPLVSRIPAHEEALRPLRPEEAVWLPPTDARAWASALRRASQGVFAKPSAASREKLRNEFRFTRLAGDMDPIYRDVLGIPH